VPNLAAAQNHVSINNVCKVFVSDRGNVEALRDISLDVTAGAFVSMVGPSGCGKSTLLRCLAGLEFPSSGEITIRGELVTRPPENMGIVFQRDVLLDWRTVLNNVLFQAEFRGSDRRKWIHRAKELLDLFGLSDFQNHYPWELSGGMRQRVSICRALLDSPDLLLMDEPFAALDAFTRDELNLELQKISRLSAATTFFVTHNIGEAIFLADRIVVMNRRPGRVARVIDVDLPRPRSLDMRETPEFASYAARIRGIFEEIGVLRSAA